MTSDEICLLFYKACSELNQELTEFIGLRSPDKIKAVSVEFDYSRAKDE